MNTHIAVGARVTAIVATATFAVAGCGTDDQAETSAHDVADQPDEASAFCEKYMTADSAVGLAMAGAGDPQAARDAFALAVASAPADLSVPIATLASQVEALFGDQSSGPTDDQFDTAMTDVNRWIADNCGFDRIELTAFDYGYRGTPHEIATGSYVITLANEGAEYHEIQLVRINDDVTESMHEIMELPDAEQLERITPLTGALATPGDTAMQVVALDRPGTYGIVCLLTTGWTPEADETATQPAGSPHYSHGMIAEFTVE